MCIRDSNGPVARFYAVNGDIVGLRSGGVSALVNIANEPERRVLSLSLIHI